jgi:hypothetical protein
LPSYYSRSRNFGLTQSPIITYKLEEAITVKDIDISIVPIVGFLLGG